MCHSCTFPRATWAFNAFFFTKEIVCIRFIDARSAEEGRAIRALTWVVDHRMTKSTLEETKEIWIVGDESQLRETLFDMLFAWQWIDHILQSYLEI